MNTLNMFDTEGACYLTDACEIVGLHIFFSDQVFSEALGSRV